MPTVILPRRQFLFYAAAALIGAGLGTAVRYLAIESHEIGQLCDPGTGPLWCMPRQALVQLFLPRDPLAVGALGILALLSGLGALFQNGKVIIYIAAVLCGFSAELYNADLASIGLVLTLIAAARA